MIFTRALYQRKVLVESSAARRLTARSRIQLAQVCRRDSELVAMNTQSAPIVRTRTEVDRLHSMLDQFGELRSLWLAVQIGAVVPDLPQAFRHFTTINRLNLWAKVVIRSSCAHQGHTTSAA